METKHQPSPPKDSGPTAARDGGEIKKNPDTVAPGQETRIKQAETRTKQAEVRTEQAETRTEQARTRTEQAEVRTEQAETRTEQAKTRTEHAEMRTEQAEMRTELTEKRIEQTLRASELSYRRLFEAAKDGIMILDFETGRISDANPFLLELLGISLGEMLGKTVGELSLFNGIESNHAMLEQLLKDGFVRYEDLPLETRDGRHISVEFISHVYQAADLKVIQCNIRDITERKRAKEKLAEERNLLRTLIDSMPDVIFTKDLQGRMGISNSAHVRFAGAATEEELVGKTAFDLFPAELAEVYERDDTEVFASGEPIIDREEPCINRAGVDCWLTTTKVPLRNQAGEMVGLVGMSRDITDRKRAEKAMIASELRYRRLFETAQDGILILDAETGMVVDVNPFLISLLGFSHEEFLGKAIWELGFFKDIVANEDNFAELREKEYIRYENLPFETADGRRIDVEFVSNAYLVNGGKVIQCNVRDVSARVKAEEAVWQLNVELEQRVIQRTAELEAANKELESFSYSVSHDLRAPLRAVDGFSQALLEDYGTQLPEEGRCHLRTIREGAQRMGVLIDDLLTFSRLSRRPLNKRIVETAELVRDALRDLDFKRDGLDLRIGELPPCLGDPALLKQVWQNLLSNAFKYSRKREAAVVEAGCVREKDENVYFVRDNGSGFDMRYVDKLFGVFQRLHRAEDFEGTGVGLAIVQRIVHRHGGRVWAEAAVDRGATFYFTLGGGSKL